MKKKKLLTSEKQIMVYSDQKIKIGKIDKKLFFEIGKEITTDLAEAVCLLLKLGEKKEEIWELEISSIENEIQPERCLYWLTGGSEEWSIMDNYKKNWGECYLDFQEEFGILIVNIIKRAKKLKDIKEEFEKHLNLPILYEFAISKNLI